MEKEELLQRLVKLLGEESWSEIRRIVEKAIEAQRTRLDELQELSTGLSGGVPTVVNDPKPDALTPEEIKNMTGVEGICWILKDAGYAIGNQEIRDRYFKKFGKTLSTSTLGNTLWKYKGKRFQKTGGTRFARWKIISK